MSFVPPLFKNFGKGLKDFFEKKFDYNREVKVKTTTTNGVAFESAGRAQSKGNDYAGSLKTTYKRKDFGTLELELDTDGKAKYSAEADQLSKGVVVKVSGDQAPSAALDVSYRQEYAAIAGVVNGSKKGTSLEPSLALGYDGVAVGAGGKFDTSSNVFVDYNAGVEFQQPDYTLTAKTTNSADKVGLHYLHNLNPDLSVGSSFEYNIASVNRFDSTLTLGGSYNIDRDTLIKGKINSDAIVSGVVEHRLYNPKLKVGVAAEFNARNNNALPEKFGLSLGFGDF